MATKKAPAKKTAPKTVDTNSLQTVIKYLSSLITMEAITLGPTKKGMFVYATDGVASARVEIPSNGLAIETNISVEPDALLKVLSGREANVKLDKGGLAIVGSKYKANIAIEESEHDGSFTGIDKAESTHKFTPEAWAWMQDCVQKLALEQIPREEPVLYAKLSSKGGMVCVFDPTQMAFARAINKKELLGDLSTPIEILLPFDLASRVFRALPFDQTQLIVTAGGLLIKTRHLQAYLPLTAPESTIGTDAVVERVNALSKFKGSKLILYKEQVDQFLLNADGLKGQADKVITFSKSKTGVKLECKSVGGSVTEIVQGSCPVGFSVDFRFMQSMTRRASGNFEVQTDKVDPAFAVAALRTDDELVAYVAALSADESDEG